MMVLGIETSCDETGVAVYDGARGLLADVLHSQSELHASYGGVVPELASRDHSRRLPCLVQRALGDAGVRPAQLDAVAYTAGPGLAGALMCGALFARALAQGLGVAALGVHHMEGHLLAPLLEDEPPQPPLVALLVSGGHSMLVRVRAIGDYECIGDTLDDAVGEAFDKVAVMLGLGYPGGAALERLAAQGERERHRLPRPLCDRAGLDFSFSGLKTATMMLLRKVGAGERAHIAAAFQEAACDTLAIKCRRALEHTGLERLVVAGGVAANGRLRELLGQRLAGARLYYPRPRWCTDNGAMIACAGHRRLAAGQRDEGAVQIRARWDLASLPPCA